MRARFSPPFPIRIDRSDDDIVTPCVPLRVVTAVTASSWHGGVVGGDGASAKGLQGDVRSPDQIAHFFDGLELLEPGLVGVSAWRPGPLDAEISVPITGAVGRKAGPEQSHGENGSLGPGQGAS